jgi:hypothetical protein
MTQRSIGAPAGAVGLPGGARIGEEKCHAASRYLSELIVAVVPLGAMTVDAQEPMH